MKTSSLAAALVVGLSMGSQAYGQRVLYELRGEAWGAENRIQQSATDLLGLEPSGVVSVPMVAKFLFDRDTAPRVVNGSLAGDGQFEYEHALLDASISMNGVCFGLARPPVPDDYRLKLSITPPVAPSRSLSLTFQARDLSIPTPCRWRNSAAVSLSKMPWSASTVWSSMLRRRHPDDATIPATTDFFDVTPYRTMGASPHDMEQCPSERKRDVAGPLPALAELPTFTVKTDPLAPTPRLTINGIQNRAAFLASAPTSPSRWRSTPATWQIPAETGGYWPRPRASGSAIC
jgi:hypothetical protein